MKPTVIEDITGKDLPPAWAAAAGVAGDEEISIIIQPPREVRLKALFDLMHEMSEEAEKRGLTEEKLQELLRDD